MPKCAQCGAENVEGTPLCRECGTTLPQKSGSQPLPDRDMELSEEDARVVELVQVGKKIDAVKLYREIHCVGLAEAKVAVETLAAGGTPEAKAGPGANDDLVELVRRGKKIGAIKIYRERHNVGLKEAKDAVEALAAEHEIATQGSGCAGVVLLGLVGVVAGAWRILA